MAFNKIILAATALLALPIASNATPVQRRTTGASVQGTLGVDTFWNDYDGGQDVYTFYSGNGSIEAGWPSQQNWISFNEMWMINQKVMQRSCDVLYNVSNNSAQELTDLYYSIKQVSQETRVDHRFILAAIMQETRGCVRAKTSESKDGIKNPGLLQDYKGNFTCNDGSNVQTPCPKANILGMIRDGVAGTAEGHGYAEDISNQASVANIEFAQAYYRAARFYNSGEIDASGDLGKGGATHCYASDIANRLTGWVEADTKCTLDSTNSTTSS